MNQREVHSGRNSKRRTLVRLGLLAAMALLVGSCAATAPDSGSPPAEGGGPAPGRSTQLDIAMLSKATWPEAELEVSLTDVASDSRCPEGTTCIWAGNAVVQLSAARRGQTESFAVRLGSGGSTGETAPDFVDQLGFRFEVVRLTPVPAPGRTIDRLSYQVTVRVTRL
jgi:hypothetical protein